MHIFRDHKRAMLIFMFLAIGVPMLFFGIPQGTPGMDGGVDVELARVAGVPVMASEFRRNLELAARRAARGGEQPTYLELEEQGVAGEVMQEMLASALIKKEEEKRGFNVDQSLLEERLRDDPSFKDDEGTFIPARYNAWVTNNEGMDWDAVFEGVQEQVSRQVYMETVLAAGNRVLDKDIEQELKDNATKIQMEYAKIEKPVVPTEEEIAKFYADNQERYRKPASHTAEYVAFSLLPAPNDKVNEVLAKAKAGEDFAALADQYSDLETKNGGELGWMSERPTELDYRKPLFALTAGGVSEPVPGPGGFYIYKVDEERMTGGPETPAETPVPAEAPADGAAEAPAEAAPVETPQVREVFARHIYIAVEVPAEKKAELELKANELSAKAKELYAKAKEAGTPLDNALAVAASELSAASEVKYEVKRAEGFTVESTEIVRIPRVDAFQFRRVADEEGTKKTAGQPEFPVVTGGENLYVVDTILTTEGAVPPPEEVRVAVTEDVIADKKNGEAYKAEIAALATEIKAQAKTLDEVKEKFPDLNLEIKETAPFSKADMLFQQQIYLQTQDIYAALEGKPENELAGPLTDFLGATYFIALTKREEPTEEAKAKWDEEGKALREQRSQMAGMQLLQDYLKDLRERELLRVDWKIDQEVYDMIIGREPADAAEKPADPAATPATDVPVEAAPAAAEAPAEPAPAPAAESAPANP